MVIASQGRITSPQTSPDGTSVMLWMGLMVLVRRARRRQKRKNDAWKITMSQCLVRRELKER